MKRLVAIIKLPHGQNLPFRIVKESTLHLHGMQVILMGRIGMKRRDKVPFILLKERTGIQM